MGGAPHGFSAYDDMMRALTSVKTDVRDLKTAVDASGQIRAVTEHMDLNNERKEGD